ncbi:MAG: RusA family crossover junction endodeoxyribonuclease [Azoarcus sp.]|jgi:Holliday junction resolvase RusA-like endonuclease|nr:RusA family crossover junction endodeoxyribonuclease [Azoarcus sp.]
MIAFHVPGQPVGKGRPRFARRGKFIATYTPEKTAGYEQLVRLAAHQAMQGRPPVEGPVSVEVSLSVVPPASWSKRRQAAALAGETLPTTKPDLDNLIKAILDGMAGVVMADDKQVSDLVARKRYALAAGADVSVTTKEQTT